MNNNYDALIDGIQKRNLTDEEYKQLETLVHFVRNIRYEAGFGVPFISGQMGEGNPSVKLAEWISICPAYGCDFSVLYKRVDDDRMAKKKSSNGESEKRTRSNKTKI